MKITIAQRYRPFSHQPGSRCLIPGSPYFVEAYPSLIRIKKLSGEIVEECALDISGPLQQFTLMQDLERGYVKVFSEAYSLCIMPDCKIILKKRAPTQISFSHERLSLGSHKKQDWQAIKRRVDFREIFPIWFQLGSLLALPPRSGDNRGTFALLEQCQLACERHQPETIIPEFKKLFLAGFEEMLIPRACDTDYQGILKSEAISVDSPLYLLTEGAQIIRSLFIAQNEHEISILPNLPPEFFEGRLVAIELPPFGKLDIEWSKKMVRRLFFYSNYDGEIVFHFPRSIVQYRLREIFSGKEKICQRGESLEIKSGSHYLLDRFQK